MTANTPNTYESFRDFWANKTPKVIQKEIDSMRRYMEKHSAAYAWHGANVPPGSIGDGDKLSALRDALDISSSRTAANQQSGIPGEFKHD